MFNIDDCLENRLENLFFCDFFKIAKSIHEIDILEDKVELIAELFIRCYLNPCPEYIELLKVFLPNGEWFFFSTNFPTLTSSSRIENLWVPRNEFSKLVLVATQKRVKRLLTIDGFIPVYATGGLNKAWFIPFTLIEYQDDMSLVIDASSKGIELWSNEVAKISTKWQVKLHINSAKIPLTGNSLMLPVQLAVWRKENILPNYDPFRLLATGAFDADNRVKCVEVADKLAAANQWFANYYFIYPSTTRCDSINYNHYLLLEGSTKEETKAKAQELIEQRNLAEFTLNYAINRLPIFNKSINGTQYRDWDRTIEQLKNLALFSDYNSPNEYLQHLMLLSVAYCHAGRSAEASETNAEAQAFAEEHGLIAQELRLKIEELVLLQDTEEFEKISHLQENLAERLASLDSPDLLMRFHGTMGQAHAYGYLAEVDGFSPEESLNHFKEALAQARKQGIPEEIAQDTNYIHLWHAIFAPNTKEEQKAFDNARKQIGYLSEEEQRIKNKNYLLRQKCFSLYRYYLTTNKVPNFSLADLRMTDADDWQQACWGKYIGTLLMAKGEFEQASECFDFAISSIAHDTYSTIKAFIRFSVLVEAYRQTLNKKYKDEAISYSARFCDIENWLIFLNDTKQKFPGLNYWY